MSSFPLLCDPTTSPCCTGGPLSPSIALIERVLALHRCKPDTYVQSLRDGIEVLHDGQTLEKKCSNCSFGKSDSDLPMFPLRVSMSGNVTALQIVESIVGGKLCLGLRN